MEPALLICAHYNTLHILSLHSETWQMWHLQIVSALSNKNQHWPNNNLKRCFHVFSSIEVDYSCHSPVHWEPCTSSWRSRQTPRPSWSQTDPGCGRTPPEITQAILWIMLCLQVQGVCLIFQNNCRQMSHTHFISRLLDDISPRLLSLVLIPAHHVDDSTWDRDPINVTVYQQGKIKTSRIYLHFPVMSLYDGW